jgi:hypothetical protein
MPSILKRCQIRNRFHASLAPVIRRENCSRVNIARPEISPRASPLAIRSHRSPVRSAHPNYRAGSHSSFPTLRFRFGFSLNHFCCTLLAHGTMPVAEFTSAIYYSDRFQLFADASSRSVIAIFFASTAFARTPPLFRTPTEPLPALQAVKRRSTFSRLSHKIVPQQEC